MKTGTQTIWAFCDMPKRSSGWVSPLSTTQESQCSSIRLILKLTKWLPPGLIQSPLRKSNLEKLYGLVDFSALDDIQEWYKDFLKPLRRLSQEKKEALARKLGERIAEAQNLLEEKYRKSPLATNKSKEKASEKPEILLLKQLKENPRRTKEEFAEILSLSRATITRSLQKLVAEGKIRRLGSNKTGFWEVLE